MKTEENGVTHRSLYRAMVSVKTSLVFLTLFGLFFIIGTIFPQDAGAKMLEEYADLCEEEMHIIQGGGGH